MKLRKRKPMAKYRHPLLSGIDLEDEDVAAIMGNVSTVKTAVKKELPAIKTGIKSVESDVLRNGKKLYDLLTDEDGPLKFFSS